MSTRSSRTIKIIYDGQKKNIIVENEVLKKSTLVDNFPEGGKLTYKINNEIYVSQTDGNNIILNPDVDHYDLHIQAGNNI